DHGPTHRSTIRRRPHGGSRAIKRVPPPATRTDTHATEDPGLDRSARHRPHASALSACLLSPPAHAARDKKTRPSRSAGTELPSPPGRSYADSHVDPQHPGPLFSERSGPASQTDVARTECYTRHAIRRADSRTTTAAAHTTEGYAPDEPEDEVQDVRAP